MHLQENTVFDLWPWPWGQCHLRFCLLSTSCDQCTCKFWSCYIQRFRRRCIYKKIHYLTFDPRSHEMLCSTLYIMWPIQLQKFEVATSIGLGDAFTRQYIIWPLALTLGHMKCCPVSSTSCDLCSYKVWSCNGQWFRRRNNYKKRHIGTHWQQTDFGTKLIYPFF